MNGFNCIKDFKLFTENLDLVRKSVSYYNFTRISQGSENDSQNWPGYYIKIVMYVIVILMSLIGNLLVIFIICLNKFMRKSTNFFILNLAICDLAILFSCIWVQILLTINKFWILGKAFCKINSFLQMVSIISSVLTLSMISCDRYIGIVHPLKSKKSSKRNYYYIIAAIWIVSVIISLPTYMYRTYTERIWADFTEKHCDDLGWPTTYLKNENGCIIKTTRPLKRIYYTTVIILLFFLPFFIMLISYSIIINKLWKRDVIGENTNSSNINDALIKKRKKVLFF